ncbi:hypothetical protein EDB83DRAFT_470292 [Lactarius deliciosus]|nr:hypothetical protein EDB83DRAFT_470292 [Lactarius deliciosus]
MECVGDSYHHTPPKGTTYPGLDNGRNLNYMVNITLGGQPLQVLVDTGSSDLWVSDSIVAAHDTGVSSVLSYDIGAVSGKWLASTFQVVPQLLWDTTGREYQNSTVGVSGVYSF